MLQLSDMFSGINEEMGIFDLQSALGSQGVNLQEGYSIPIYEIFYLKIAPKADAGILSASLEEYNVLSQLNRACGTICCTLNLFEMDLLTLLGAVCCYIPSSLQNAGMYVFVKDNIPDLVNITEDIAVQILNLSGLNIEDLGGTTMNLEIAAQALDIVIKMLISALDRDLSSKGIRVFQWQILANFLDELQASGDYQQMLAYRKQNNLINPGGNTLLGGGSAMGRIEAFGNLFGNQY